MNNVNCRVYDDFNRIPAEKIDRFKGIPAANLDDVMGRQAAACAELKPVGKAGIVGPAFTVKVPAGDNLMMHYAVDKVKEGDVLVIDAGGSINRATFGDILVQYLVTKKVAGIIVDGAIRDKEDIIASGMPVYCRGVVPDGPWKNGPGEVNTPVCIGGRVVNPGDIVVADSDGIVFIRPEDADDVYEKVQKLMQGEAIALKKIAETGEMIRPWVMEKLNALGCEFHEKYEG